MLSRRNLRVKVMQVMYAIEHSNQLASEEAVRMLEKSIEKSYKLLAFNLSLPVRLADQIRKEADIKTSKLLPTAEDLQFSTRLADNPYIKILSSEKKLSECLRLTPTDEEVTLVKELFKKLSDEKEYKDYCTSTGNGENEKKIIQFIFNKVIHKSPAYAQYVEDNFPECIGETGKINSGIEEVLAQLSPESTKPIEFPDSEEEEKFARELLQKTIVNNDQYTALIKPRLKNWDVDRIAHLDMILMKLALCELLCFDQIPVKVSINEYIDISKTYSTPRSKDFINGILDNIMHELKEKNEIRKTGRGLVE